MADHAAGLTLYEDALATIQERGEVEADVTLDDAVRALEATISLMEDLRVTEEEGNILDGGRASDIVDQLREAGDMPLGISYPGSDTQGE